MEAGEQDEAGKHIKRTTRELPEDWGKYLSGRRVDFGTPGKEKGLAWGIELSFPLTEDIRNHLGKIGIIIPKRIDKIRLLDMHPQESLDRGLETISSDHDEYFDTELTNLQKLADTTKGSYIKDPVTLMTLMSRSRARDVVRRIFRTAFTTDREAKKDFNHEVKSSRGNELLLVEGHGVGDPTKIGERYRGEVKDDKGNIIQKSGNYVDINELLQRYNQPETYGAIVIASCHIGTGKIKAIDVPAVYARETMARTPITGLLLDPKIVVRKPA